MRQDNLAHHLRDPAGAVGPNHYISVINTVHFQIFDDNQEILSLEGWYLQALQFSLPVDSCDLTASYDQRCRPLALTFLGGGAQVAVSDGRDPVNDGWTLFYTYSIVNDYPKLSIWRDGYYITDNTGGSNKIHVFERSAMIDAASAGTTPQIVSFNLPGFDYKWISLFTGA